MIFYGLFTIGCAFAIALTLWVIGNKKCYKFWRKHLSKRKTVITSLAFISLLFLWAELESVFTQTTMLILWIIHAIIFFGFCGWSIWKLMQDKKRITAAEKRRKKKEEKQR